METIGENSWICRFKAKHISYELPEFEDIWKLKPEIRGKIKLFGKEVDVPRWQQSYEKNYYFSGMYHEVPTITPEPLLNFLNICRHRISPGLNGILVNWYGPEDYIGFHSDDEKNLLTNEPIVTLTLMEYPSETRKFVLKPIGDGSSKEYQIGQGDIFVMGGDCQKTHKHGLPKSKKYKSRRISITIRGFQS